MLVLPSLVLRCNGPNHESETLDISRSSRLLRLKVELGSLHRTSDLVCGFPYLVGLADAGYGQNHARLPRPV